MTLLNGTKVKVRLPCRYGYNPKAGTVISRAKDRKYVILLREPVFVEELGKDLDIVAVRRQKLERA